MRIISFNANGIRSAAKKGFFEWLHHQQADVVCVQELKAQEKDLDDAIRQPSGYKSYFHFAEKKGYSGVGIYTKHEPTHVQIGLSFPLADEEGRYIALTFHDLTIASLYLPSGTSGDERQAQKYIFLDQYQSYLKQQSNQPHIICGDFNIAHREIDLKNWRANQKHSGFLKEEREWMDHLFSALPYEDAFRLVNPHPDQYTWWSNRGQAWAKNVGWRIDYQVISRELSRTVKSAQIYKDSRFSDHAPLIMDYDILFRT